MRVPTEQPVHPGEVLREQFLRPNRLSAYRVAKELHLSRPVINDLVRESRRVTPRLALLLASFFGNEPGFWLDLQQEHDLWRLGQDSRMREELEAVTPYTSSTR